MDVDWQLWTALVVVAGAVYTVAWRVRDLLVGGRGGCGTCGTNGGCGPSVVQLDVGPSQSVVSGDDHTGKDGT